MTPAPDGAEPMTPQKTVKRAAVKCLGCGHRLDQHRLYAHGGKNRHGCDRVCIVDGCRFWNDCRFAARVALQRAEQG